MSEPSREVSYPIAYRPLAGRGINPDFKGKGTLTIRAAGPTYVFHGKKNAVFAGAPVEEEFQADEIWNVTVEGRCVSFKTSRGVAGKKDQRFLFYCENVTTAHTVASLLPARQDDDFAATREFGDRLEALADAQSPWTSATNIIIALNVLMFVIMGCLGAGWFEVDSMQPYVDFGANNGAVTTDGEWWRLLTSMFVHFGLVHLALNMWALFQAGHFLEKLQGRSLYVLTYLGSGLAGGLVSIAWHGDQTWSAGASGAIFGVYGAVLGYMLREKQGLPPGVYKPMMKSTLTFAGYNILYGLRAGVDNSAHLGGLFGGLLLGWLLALPVDRDVRLARTKQKLQLGLATLAVILVAGFILTPRFDYNLRDERNFAEASREFDAKEAGLLKTHEEAMARIQKGADGTAHTAWMAAELVPLYVQWDQRIMALQLEPKRRTAIRREAVHKIFQLRIASYQHLITGLQANPLEALGRYFHEEGVIAREIDKFQKSLTPPS